MLREQTWNGHPVKASTINNRSQGAESILPLGERERVHAGAAHEEDQTVRDSFTLIVPLTDEEIFRIFKAVQTPRDNAITALLFHCGLRASELAGLRIEDVNLEQYVLKVTGKDAKERYVPSGESTTRRVESYLNARLRDVLTDRLFLTTRRAPMERRNLLGLMRILKGGTGIPRLHARSPSRLWIGLIFLVGS